ncbi:hypothetical protein NPX13_g2712 [Xylaria arbuscula]|uniref:Uncharacterized protein n=1 Tax=Xylaria arbuscula TaxID=114810 RepID=A0A9W8TQU7_9PEZI|nr:hypothetical protein NPX13_g2712 [Xylaria arbuscula]
MVERSDPRGAFYIQPTWTINGIPLSQYPSADSRVPNLDAAPRTRKPTFEGLLRGLRSSELREIIMNCCLKSLNTHKDVVDILKRMQAKKPRPICLSGRVQNPTAGMYLYCRTHRELIDIIIELAKYDETGCFEQDVRDLARVIQEKDGSED